MSKKDAAEVELFPGVGAPDDRGPFGGNSIRLTATREVNVSQLQTEIIQRTRTEVMVCLQGDSPEHIASEGHPVTLFVSPGNLNERVVQAVVDSHVAQRVGPPPVGVDPQAATSGFNAASLPADAQALVAKLAAGENLKAAESSDLLRAILGIESQG